MAWQQRAVLLTGEEFLQTQLDFRAAGQAAADRAKQLKEARLNREAVLRMRIKENEEKNLKRVDALKEKLQAEKADHKATKAKKKAIEAQLRLVIKEKEDLKKEFDNYRKPKTTNRSKNSSSSASSGAFQEESDVALQCSFCLKPCPTGKHQFPSCGHCQTIHACSRRSECFEKFRIHVEACCKKHS